MALSDTKIRSTKRTTKQLKPASSNGMRVF